ncbi:MAG TPA: MerR family transcriptional regulator [Flavisolibacter sp.]|jgi:DNA-binding transcriptional MerR regulator|nr:MerR family transcriptional regulator [Flavisolibacter sp.]
MKTFSLAELAQYSLVKAHTFRTWEKRFKSFVSKRTPKNIRYYTLDDLAFFLDISLLNRFGEKISSLDLLDKATVRQKASLLKGPTAMQEDQINQLILDMMALRVEQMESRLDAAVKDWGVDQTIEEIILPLIERLQLFSYKKHTSSEYHFVVTTLRKKLILGIESFTPKEGANRTALLFLPEGEHFDLLLLYLDYRLQKSGLGVLYLGTNISPLNLKNVVQQKTPDVVLTYVSNAQLKEAKVLSPYLEQKPSDVPYIVTVVNDTYKGFDKYEKVRFIPYAEAAAVACSSFEPPFLQCA